MSKVSSVASGGLRSGCLREHGASERGSRRFFLATRRDLRGDTTEGNS